MQGILCGKVKKYTNQPYRFMKVLTVKISRRKSSDINETPEQEGMSKQRMMMMLMNLKSTLYMISSYVTCFNLQKIK